MFLITVLVSIFFSSFTLFVVELPTLLCSSSTVFLMLQFTCQGQHLKKLVAGIGASNIIKAGEFGLEKYSHGNRLNLKE